MIHQILHNLVNNARLAKYPSRVEVCFELKSESDGNGSRDEYWCLDVTDNGPGVPAFIQQSMFDAYVTTRSTGEKEKGMGLGLTISRQIALDHGGKLVLARTSSEGTVMRLFLPKQKAASQSDEKGRAS